MGGRNAVNVYFHSSEQMGEVADASARLVVGASVYLGKEAPWEEYVRLYRRVYVENGLRVLRPDGYFLAVITDQYSGGRVVPRGAMLLDLMAGAGYELVDEKIWKRRKGDFFQPPFSFAWVFRPPGGTAARPRGAAYLAGVWDYPQTAGGEHNAYPDELCRLVVESFTAPGDLLVDPFAGTGRLLGVAGRMGRRAVGYEIDPSLRSVIADNTRGAGDWF